MMNINKHNIAPTIKIVDQIFIKYNNIVIIITKVYQIKTRKAR